MDGTRYYAPILRVPWKFPFQAGIAGYRRVDGPDAKPFCVITGKPITRDGNTGRSEAARAAGKGT